MIMHYPFSWQLNVAKYCNNYNNIACYLKINVYLCDILTIYSWMLTANNSGGCYYAVAIYLHFYKQNITF